MLSERRSEQLGAAIRVWTKFAERNKSILERTKFAERDKSKKSGFDLRYLVLASQERAD